MEKLIDIKSEIFYYGTIIIMKDCNIDSFGKISDIRYGLISDSNDRDNDFRICDLYYSIGSCILHDLKPNVENHHGVNKTGIKEWVRMYFKLFYTKEWFKETVTDNWLDNIIYIDDISNFFSMANHNLKI